MEGNETEHRPANVCFVAQVFTSIEEREKSFKFILMNYLLFPAEKLAVASAIHISSLV